MDIIPNSRDVGDAVATVSIVQGLTFVLVRVSSLEVLARTKQTKRGLLGSDVGLPDGSFIGIYVYYVFPKEEGDDGVVKLQTRMFEKELGEDPATGSAASCLAAYLSMQGEGESGRRRHYAYEITQGVEIGRQSDIRVDVDMDMDVTGEGTERRVESIWLSGKAVEVMQGTINV